MASVYGVWAVGTQVLLVGVISIGLGIVIIINESVSISLYKGDLLELLTGCGPASLPTESL